MRSALLGILAAVAHSTAQFTMPVFSDMQSGHFDVNDMSHVYAHHGHDHSHDHSAPHHPTHRADDDAMPHVHNYVPIRIIRDCVGNFAPEPQKCVCSASEIGFAQNTCEAGQACYSDGGCRDMQQVTCKVEEDVGGTTRVTAFYNGEEELADGETQEFSFTDAGPGASFTVSVEFEGLAGSGNTNAIDTCDAANFRVRCTAAAGPYRSIDAGLRAGQLWGDELSVEMAECKTVPLPSGSSVSGAGAVQIGPITGSLRIQPYIPASQGSCARATSQELCNGMRAIGARCCYDFEADRCTYDEQCYYRSGPVAVTNRDFAKEVFGDHVISVFGRGDDFPNDNLSDDDGPLMGLARSLGNLIN